MAASSLGCAAVCGAAAEDGSLRCDEVMKEALVDLLGWAEPDSTLTAQQAAARLAVLCQRFSSSDAQKTAPTCSIYYIRKAPPITLPDLAERLAEWMFANASTFVVAQVFMSRFFRVDPSVFHPTTAHKILVTCAVVAAKWTEDKFFSNSYYAECGGIGSAATLNRMESDLVNALSFHLFVSETEFDWAALSSAAPGPEQSSGRQPPPTISTLSCKDSACAITNAVADTPKTTSAALNPAKTPKKIKCGHTAPYPGAALTKARPAIRKPWRGVIRDLEQTMTSACSMEDMVVMPERDHDENSPDHVNLYSLP